MSSSLDDDPTDFEGQSITAGQDGEDGVPKSPRSNAATGASAAGVRAVSAQLVAFYFRAPVKAFFRTRVEYVVLSLAARKVPGLIGDFVQLFGMLALVGYY